MDTHGFYQPSTRVNWDAQDAYSTFKRWRKEVERIVDGPLATQTDAAKINHIYIWAGAQAEILIDARRGESPDLKIETPTQLLDQLQACITHSTKFREAREEFYSLRQRPDETAVCFFARILELHKVSEFPSSSNFLIADRLIHGCHEDQCRRKLMTMSKEATAKECLQVLQQSEALNRTMNRMSAIQPSTLPNESVDAAYNDPTRRSQNNAGRRPPQFGPLTRSNGDCRWCKGTRHPRQNCPAREATCRKCNKDVILPVLASVNLHRMPSPPMLISTLTPKKALRLNLTSRRSRRTEKSQKRWLRFISDDQNKTPFSRRQKHPPFSRRQKHPPLSRRALKKIHTFKTIHTQSKAKSTLVQWFPACHPRCCLKSMVGRSGQNVNEGACSKFRACS